MKKQSDTNQRGGESEKSVIKAHDPPSCGVSVAVQLTCFYKHSCLWVGCLLACLHICLPACLLACLIVRFKNHQLSTSYEFFQTSVRVELPELLGWVAHDFTNITQW